MKDSDSPILSICSNSTEPLEDPHSGLHPSKDRVLIFKVWCRCKSEEELRTYKYSDARRWEDEDVRTVGVGARVGHC